MILVCLALATTAWATDAYSSIPTTVTGQTGRTQAADRAQTDPSDGASGARGDFQLTLLSTGFGGLPQGRLDPLGFIWALGGTDDDPAAYADTSVVTAPGHGRVLRTTLAAGTVHSIPRGTNGIAVFIPLPHRVERACIAYDIRFAKDFDWSLGGKLPGLLGVAPGVSPGLPTGGQDVGDLGWSGRLMWLGPGAYRMPGRENTVASYMYGPQQPGKYGENIWWNTSFRRGVWQHVKQCYEMNTVGRHDGLLRAWLDGREVVNRTDYVYRTRDDVSISHLSWGIFRGGHTLAWAGQRTGAVDIDNVTVTGDWTDRLR